MSLRCRLFATHCLVWAVGCSAVHTQAVVDAGPSAGTCQPCIINGDCASSDTCSPLPAGCGGGSVCVSSATPLAACVQQLGCSPPAGDAGPMLDAGAAPDAGDAPDAGPTPDGGMMPIGTLTADAGGTVPELLFAVVGDTRPPLPNDDGAYPTPIITKIFSDIESLSPRVPIVIGTGDYQFTGLDLLSPAGSHQQTQLGAYNMARQQFSGVFWPAMGNHECDSLGQDNCGPGTLASAGGDPANYTVWFSLFITPIGETTPYYSRTVSATDGSWSAKFIILALNYWSDAQETWFASQLAGPSTTYTFVVHHEQNGASDGPPSLATVEGMEAGHETLSLVGHSHIWQFTGSQPQVIVGNGGAPLDASGNVYGFTLVSRQPDGSIQGTNYCSYGCAADAGPTPQAVNQFNVP